MIAIGSEEVAIVKQDEGKKESIYIYDKSNLEDYLYTFKTKEKTITYVSIPPLSPFP